MPPHVDLMDIGVPGLDGYAAARLLRQRPEGRTAYLVALTGFGQHQDAERAFAAGFDAHMTKPADLEELRARLSSQPAHVREEPVLNPGPFK